MLLLAKVMVVDTIQLDLLLLFCLSGLEEINNDREDTVFLFSESIAIALPFRFDLLVQRSYLTDAMTERMLRRLAVGDVVLDGTEI